MLDQHCLANLGKRQQFYMYMMISDVEYMNVLSFKKAENKTLKKVKLILKDRKKDSSREHNTAFYR